MIRYEAFGKAYGPVVAIRGLTLQARAGETLALVGPNGSGKTTCLKAALGLVRPTSGTVRLDGRDPAEDPAARAEVGYLPQRLRFPPGATAAELLRFHAALRGAPPGRVREVVARFGLEEAAARKADTFSGGMHQRLGLALAMLGDPTVLILDEPSAALDPTAALEVRETLRDVRRGGGSTASAPTILFASHDLAEVGALADRIAVFRDGELCAVGSASELAAGFALPSRIRVRADTEGGDRLAEAARRAGASRVRLAEGVLTCELDPDRVAGVIEAFRAVGSPLEGLSVREPGVEDVYRAATSPAPRLVA